MDHPSRQLRNPHTDEDVSIDQALVGIIGTAWQLGIRTLQCCQEDESCDSAWTHFASVDDAAWFVDALFPEGDDDGDLHDRLRDWEVWTPEPSSARLGWRWKVAPARHDGGKWTFDVLVEFPTCDIPEVERRLQKRLDGG